VRCFIATQSYQNECVDGGYLKAFCAGAGGAPL
jgi:hypothetical protein